MTTQPRAPWNTATQQPELGVFTQPFEQVNLDQARVRGLGLRLPAALSRLRLKQWQHFGLVLPDLFVGLALVDAGFLQTSWCHVVPRLGDESSFEHARRAVGWGRHVQLGRALWDDACRASWSGYQLEVDNRLGQGEHLLRLQVSPSGEMPGVEGELRCIHDLQRMEPLVVVLPLAGGRAMYSHKAALPLEGEIRVGGSAFRASPESAVALVDIHKAHYPHHTWWRWATFGTRLGDGRLLGLNLTHNVVPEASELNENAVWLDGKLHRLGRAIFEPGEPLTSPWRLRSACGAVELRFSPQGERSENLRLGPVRSVFHQFHGLFDGQLRAGGETLQLQHAFGLCEDHDSRW